MNDKKRDVIRVGSRKSEVSSGFYFYCLTEKLFSRENPGGTYRVLRERMFPTSISIDDPSGFPVTSVALARALRYAFKYVIV